MLPPVMRHQELSPCSTIISYKDTCVQFCCVTCWSLQLSFCRITKVNLLQRVLSAAAKVIYGCQKYDHVTSLLYDILHCLKVLGQITCKLCLLTFKAIHGLAPNYFADLCQPLWTITSRHSLRSATVDDPFIRRTNTKFGLQTWNT